ncbi:MAG: helix-turn-helix domain-containing protein [bacterium]
MDKNSSSDMDNIIDELNFREQFSSAALNYRLKNVEDLASYFSKNKENMIPHNLVTHLEMLLKQKGIKKSKVIEDSQIDRKYGYQIFSGEKNPSREKLIALAFGFHLSDEETQTMLKLSGNRELYVRDKRDAIILYALQRGKSILETNDLLYEFGFKVLGTPEK